MKKHKIMKIKMILFLVAFVGFTLTSSAQKIGYINSQELMTNLPEVKEANSNLESFTTQLQKKAQQMLQSLQTKYQELERKQAQGEISPKQLEAEALKLKEEEMALQQFDQTSQQQILAKQEQLLQPIMDRVQGAIDQVAKENGYAFVLDESMGIILYADSATDLGALVKAKLGL